jgi:SPASM domain peptide maturase of grasp-with-spasm system
MLLKLFANCLPVRGYNRSIICDIQRNNFDFIPNVLCDFLQKKNIFSLNILIESYGIENTIILEEYVTFLLEKDYCYEISETDLSLFPDLGMDYLNPSVITNAILELDEINNDLINEIIAQLEMLGCKYIDLKFYANKNYSFFIDLLHLFDNSIITSINVFAKFDSQHLNIENVKDVCKSYYRVQQFFLHSAEIPQIIDMNSVSTIYVTEEKITNHSSCGIISPIYFSTNLYTFTESQKHNTCLNRKISIDVEGNIKNCPSMVKSYGNIRDTTLKEAIEKPSFKDMWYIHKDQIEVCKDCEFRHICTDCRAYIQDPNNIYSKPAKCSYNPYTSVWDTEIVENKPFRNR